MRDRYSKNTLTYFDSDEFVGEFSDGATYRVGALQLSIKDNRALYKARGNPYIISCMAYACEKLGKISAQDLIKFFDIPLDKQYCAILVEELWRQV